MHAAINHLESKRFVGLLGIEMVDPRIRRHFMAAVIAGPLLCCSEKLRADSVAPMLRRDKPALDKADRMCGIATVSMRAQTSIDESHDVTFGVLGHEDNSGQGPAGLAGEKRLKFQCVLFGGGIRPKEMTHSSQLKAILKFRAPKDELLHCNIIKVFSFFQADY